MPHRSDPTTTKPTLAKRLGTERIVRDEHPQVVPVAEVLERLRGVLDGELRDLRAREHVRVDGLVERRAVALVLVRREDHELAEAHAHARREAVEGIERAIAGEVVCVFWLVAAGAFWLFVRVF